MIAVVTGGRDYTDRAHTYEVLDRVHAAAPIELLMHGACPVGHGGLDFLAQGWAISREISYWGMPAKFRTGEVGGGVEGPVRNARMLRTVQLLSLLSIAKESRLFVFPGGKGTRHCFLAALDMNFPLQPCCAAHPLPEVT